VPFTRDDDLVAQLRQRPDNAAVLDLVERSSAHGDLGRLLFDFAKTTGAMRVVPLASHDFPALVGTPPDSDIVVVAASGMLRLLFRAGEDEPAGARLERERATDLGPEWWRVNPFDREVSRAATALELPRWFTTALDHR
jgi:hypothetical protein